MPKFGVTNFQKWAGRPDGGGLSHSTIAVYGSMVRGFFVDEDRARRILATPGELERAALEHDAALLDNSRRTFRTALRAFLRFYAAMTGMPVEEIEFIDYRSHRDFREILTKWEDHPITPLLRAILFDEKVKAGHLEMVRWRDVERAGERARIFVKAVHMMYSVPLDVMRQLSLWGGSGSPAPKDTPVVPIEPGSLTPMPAKRMVRIAGGRGRTMVDPVKTGLL
jgi:hypothetical protein